MLILSMPTAAMIQLARCKGEVNKEHGLCTGRHALTRHTCHYYGSFDGINSEIPVVIGITVQVSNSAQFQ